MTLATPAVARRELADTHAIQALPDRQSGAALKWALGFLCGIGLSAQAVHFTVVSSLDAPHDLVKLQGSRAYLAGGKVFTIFDLSNPASPRREGQFEFRTRSGDSTSSVRWCMSPTIVAGLAILDISDPAKPGLRGTLKTHGQAKGVVVLGNQGLVVDHMTVLPSFDVSDVAKPTAAGSLFLGWLCRDVAASQVRLGLCGGFADGILRVDLAKTGRLRGFRRSLQNRRTDKRWRPQEPSLRIF